MGALLEDALLSLDGATDGGIGSRLSLTVGDAVEMPLSELPSERPDVVYLDPMFPPRTKSSLVKKDMQLLHRLLQAGNERASGGGGDEEGGGADGDGGIGGGGELGEAATAHGGGVGFDVGGAGGGGGGAGGGGDGDVHGGFAATEDKEVGGEADEAFTIGDGAGATAAATAAATLASELAMLDRARTCALRRTVVKRPRNAPPLANVPPSYSLDGSSNRFDIYLRTS